MRSVLDRPISSQEFVDAMGPLGLIVYQLVAGGYVFTYSGDVENHGLYCRGDGTPFPTPEAAVAAAEDLSEGSDVGEYEGDE